MSNYSFGNDLVH